MDSVASIADYVLRLLQVLLAWPPVILAIAGVAMWLFRHPFTDLIKRIVEGEAYGVRVKAQPNLQQQEVRAPALVAPQDPTEQWVREHPREAIERSQRVYNSYLWERALNAIFGTQLNLLEFLETKGAAGADFAELVPFHQQHQKLFGNTAYQFADYLNFLKVQDFIIYEGPQQVPRVRIAPVGINFLSYLRSAYPNERYKYRYF